MTAITYAADDDLGMMKDENLYSPVNKGLTELTPPLVSTDKENISYKPKRNYYY